MFISIDDYYDIEFYNQTIEAMKNNGLQPKEFISIKTPFNWYFKVENEPFMVNFDKLDKSNERFLVNKVQTLRANEAYKLIRRNDGVGQKALYKYIENQPLKEARESEYAVFFNAKSKQQLEQITKELPVKIYYFGKHYKNKYKVALCTNKMILNYITPEEILLEKSSAMNEPGRFESELNFKVFRQFDYLQKYTETTYFQNGKYYPVKIKSDRTDAARQAL